MGAAGIIAIVIGLVFVVLVLFAIAATLFRKVGPNQALVVYGFGGTKVVKGSGKVVWPMVQQARELSLELMSFDVAPKQDLYSSQGVAVNVEAVAQIKVKSDPISILTAAEQFMTKTGEEREGLIRLVMEGHLRGIVGQLTVEQIVKEPEMVADRMRANVAEDMSKMGLEVVSFTIKEVRDQYDYILNMGKPDIALVKRQADIATAEADRDTAIKRANALRDAKIAETVAEQDRVVAEAQSQTRQAEAMRDLEVKRATYMADVQKEKASADKVYEIETNVQQQKVVAEQVRIEQVRKQGEIAVQEAEIQRREKELIATVVRQADAEKQRIELMAEADRQRQILEATGRAEGQRLQGQAEAEVIQAKGRAEANAMQIKAAAYQEYNQAAVLDKLLSELPEVVRALSEPLTKVDKITVVSTGDGAGVNSGVNRLTSDMTAMMAQAPALFEALSGVKVGDLMRQVPQIRQALTDGTESRSANGHPADQTQAPVPPEAAPATTAPATVPEASVPVSAAAGTVAKSANGDGAKAKGGK